MTFIVEFEVESNGQKFWNPVSENLISESDSKEVTEKKIEVWKESLKLITSKVRILEVNVIKEIVI